MILIVFLLLLFLGSCAKVIDVENYKLLKDKTYAVIPFENYTSTPLAGYRIASIVEGFMRAKGYTIAPREWSFKDSEPTPTEIDEIKRSLENKVNYIVMGSVAEYEYKIGINGDPAVSFTINIFDTQQKKIIKSIVLSAKGGSNESLGTLTQKLLREVF